MPQTNTEWTLPNPIDRRPLVVINSYGARTAPCDTDDEYPEEVERRSTCWWRGPDAITELMTRIQGYYDVGWRRIILNRPNGVLEGGIPPSSIWAGMLDYKKSGFSNEIKSLLNTLSDLDFGFYAGFKLSPEPSSLLMTDEAIRVPNNRSRTDIEWYKQNYGPLRDLGVKTIIFDNASAPENVDSYEKISSLLWSMGIRSIAEAIPRSDFETLPNNQTGRLLDDNRKQKAAYMCTEQFLKNPGNINNFQFWSADPTQHEIHICMQGFSEFGTLEQTTDSENFIDGLVQAGFIVGAWGAEGKWFYNYLAQNYLGPQDGNLLSSSFPYTRGQQRTILDRPDSGLTKDKTRDLQLIEDEDGPPAFL